MFSYEERLKAVKLYLKYNSWMAVINELGYPTVNALRGWVKEYKQKGDLHSNSIRTPKYTEEDKEKAINHYLTTGKNMAKTLRELGYPNRDYLKQWIEEKNINIKSSCKKRKESVYLSENIKIQAVTDLCIREDSANKIATNYNTNRTSLYVWKEELLGKKEIPLMKKREKK